MKTWRERVAEMRARGHVTYEEMEDAYNPVCCAIGEAAQRIGIRYHEMDFDRVGLLFPDALRLGEFDRAEALLDRIDDRVLELKRAQGSSGV